MKASTDRAALSRAYFLATLGETLASLPPAERAALHAAVAATRRRLEMRGDYDTALAVVSMALDTAVDAPAVH